MTDCCILNLPSSGFDTTRLIINELPGGAIDCVNLVFTTANEFIAGTLEVYLDGVRIDPDCYVENVDLMGFTLVLDPTDGNKLKVAPRDTESLRVDYTASKANAACILNL